MVPRHGAQRYPHPLDNSEIAFCKHLAQKHQKSVEGPAVAQGTFHAFITKSYQVFVGLRKKASDENCIWLK